MAKKRSENEKVIQPVESEVDRHARIVLPDSDYQRLKGAAKRFRLSVSAYIRQAVMERIESDERKAGGRS